MVTLAIDTSAGISVSVVGPDEVVTESNPSNRQHAELLAPLIERALGRAEVLPSDVTRVVVGTGPAPFTGLRAGLVAARTFAFARGIPVFGVCSLDAVALRAARSLALPTGTRLLVLADARRKEVYGRRYLVESVDDGTFGAIGVDEARVLARDGSAFVERPSALTDVDATVVVTAGPLPVLGDVVQVDADNCTLEAGLLASIARDDLAAGAELACDPLYLRRPDAQVPTQAKRSAGA
ncbi:tRNA (adenosine(37)-N6)-threonylcarbamoyltransferase complex dimerization subunit type 1 TsaB [Rarobacter incanus]|uniref:tRNA threonylcarbamoyladenosine biosynthesis protein TsaB n=1 Tax=Rarobacter incanus TaxID=153494 RepID=A0A542SR81_9MICO|nr:tRNA (adenosine(37)-N6)-threonylcarbamoyltransferase complex dimerization subunit type 1 TsaB [Rarobacter incanus]TQK77098.1 tRNA threonylcarbamoyladenosine biosynthesis protein TsaB [Rarobacter incanus]